MRTLNDLSTIERLAYIQEHAHDSFELTQMDYIFTKIMENARTTPHFAGFQFWLSMSLLKPHFEKIEIPDDWCLNDDNIPLFQFDDEHMQGIEIEQIL